MSVMNAVDAIRQRLEMALEWYRGCDASSETVANAQRELSSLWNELKWLLPKNYRNLQVRVRLEFDTLVAELCKVNVGLN